ncbi:glycerophosphotransferase [Komagataeibacter kakiaceti JCM 25156]|uniref:CDP-glycerol glycerophosphotransferase family protein n=1 Tax=Komagataeibacter kakiaceti TaxID=943261 RepID=UPI000470D6F2|nr:CDP-glycerol glycerophosphotransferase family protein [Komagataeibacter kakiaceti]
MKVAFLYIAEAYQCYHGASIAAELSHYPNVEIVIYYNDPACLPHLKSLERGANTKKITYKRLRRSPFITIAQSIKKAGLLKPHIMKYNAEELNQYDAIVAVENTAAWLRDFGVTHPKLILNPHGSGDRKNPTDELMPNFDLVLVSGQQKADDFLTRKLIRPDGHAVTGYVKYDMCEGWHDRNKSLFPNKKPIVIYNPHYETGFNSMPRFLGPMLEGFRRQNDFNLIVAPHIKMYRRSYGIAPRLLEMKSRPNILIDTRSKKLLDMTYTTAADIYVGDLSSQIYEFLMRPRPCVFLNTARVEWRDNPFFRHWQYGDVVDDPKDLMAAIRAAPSRHYLYRDLQKEMAERTLGQMKTGASRRCAKAIMDFLNQKKDK